MFAVAVAVPPLPSSTVTVAGTVPSKSAGAVHRVAAVAGVENVPFGAVQRYVNVSPSGSRPCAVRPIDWPASTVHGGPHVMSTVGGRFAAGGGGGGGSVGGGVGGGGGTYRRTPG